MSRKIDLTGQIRGRLTVMRYLGKARDGHSLWLCQCTCGNTREVQGNNLKPGKTSSCGCLTKERMTQKNFRHGKKYTPEYYVWAGMKRRCKNASTPGYKDYGERGISVCPAWEEFDQFLRDMGERPTPDHTLERDDVNRGYEPVNCRWATTKEQNRNQRHSIMVTHQGVTRNLGEWAELLGLNYYTLWDRYRAGQTGDHLFRPAKVYKKKAS